MSDQDLGLALLTAARRYPDRLALWALGEELTYRALFERASGIAAALAQAGIAAGEQVAILSQRSLTAYVGILGAVLAGCTYVPLNPRFPAERNSVILRLSGARALILDDQCARSLPKFLGVIPADVLVLTPESADACLDAPGGRLAGAELAPRPFADLFLRRAPDADAPAYLMFTSGTTGAPKGVPISHANIAAYLSAIAPHVALGPEDRVLQTVDLTFDLSVHDMFVTWTAGGALFSASDNMAFFAPRLIAQHAITSALLVPSPAARACEQGLLRPGCMPTLRYSLFCGEALPVSVAAAWAEAAPASTLYNFYGPTEGTVLTSWFRYDPRQDLPLPVVPIGWPIGKQRMALLDAELRPVPAGETGEIYLAGPQMMRGYWRAPQLDAQRFVVTQGLRWYRTGDLGQHSDEYGVIFGGRADRQVKIRGYRVELQEIEGTLRKASGREQVAVIAFPRTTPGNAEGTVAFVAGRAGDGAALRAASRAMLPPYMVPDKIFFVAELPLNANGKTDYNKLAEHPLLVDGAAPCEQEI
jgi:amino acid adenylation domain-containing protein